MILKDQFMVIGDEYKSLAYLNNYFLLNFK